MTSFEKMPFQPPVGTRWNVLASRSTSSDTTTYDGVEMPKMAIKLAT